ncbi:MAG: endonuclease/exonuclease/phosphatase family protein [Acidimicrobiia bacterium]
MRVVTFNIRHGEDREGTVDLRGLAAACRRLDADVLALQEVDRRMRRSGWADLPRRIRRRTGTTLVYAPALRLGLFGRYGNALLVRGAVGDVEPVRFPSPLEPRGAVLATVWVQDRPLSVAATHLSIDRDERDIQLEALLRALGRRPLPRLLLGDLNGLPEDVAPPCGRAGLRLTLAGPTFPARDATKQIDHIAYAGLELAGAEVVDTGMSDHHALAAEFE